MKPLQLAELPSPASFEQIRPRLREAILEHKAQRRIAVGERVTLLFEDRETVRWQILEMSRVEGLVEPAAIQHELDVYNQLVPGDAELSATLFIEITDMAEIRPELDRLVGIDEHVWFQIGDTSVRAHFDSGQMEEDRISAVHYVTFSLPAEAVAAFGDVTTSISLEIDHPAYRARAPLDGENRASLALDLRGGAPELVALGDLDRADDGDRDVVIGGEGRIQILRPARPKAPGHLYIQPEEPLPNFQEAPAELLAEAMEVARKMARKLEAERGSCRLLADTTGPLRIELYCPPS